MRSPSVFAPHYTTKTGHILSYIKNFLKIFCQPTASPLAARARRQSAREKKPGGGTWRRKSTAAKQNGNRRGGTAGCAPRSARGRQHAKKPCTAGRALQGFYDLSRGIRQQADAAGEGLCRGEAFDQAAEIGVAADGASDVVDHVVDRRSAGSGKGAGHHVEHLDPLAGGRLDRAVDVEGVVVLHEIDAQPVGAVRLHAVVHFIARITVFGAVVREIDVLRGDAVGRFRLVHDREPVLPLPIGLVLLAMLPPPSGRSSGRRRR